MMGGGKDDGMIARSDFEKNIRLFVTSIACKSIGDESAYTKFLNRKIHQGDPQALAMQGAINMVHEIQNELNEIKAFLEAHNHFFHHLQHRPHLIDMAGDHRRHRSGGGRCHCLAIMPATMV